MEYALAWLTLDSDRCNGCGQPRSESTAPNADGAYTATPIRCFSCAAIAAAGKRVTESAGLMFGVSRADP